MASNFAFQPFGLSQAITVGGAAPATVSLSVTAVGGTAALALASGNYIPGSIRIANEGTASVFLNFGATAATVSVTVSNGMRMLSNSVETFGTKNLPFLAAVCASTFTVTLTATLGEGI
jgi:hypothetical protein